jgi:hypothetical protein
MGALVQEQWLVQEYVPPPPPPWKHASRQRGLITDSGGTTKGQVTP